MLGILYVSLFLFCLPYAFAAKPATGSVIIKSSSGVVKNTFDIGETVIIEAEYLDSDGTDDIKFCQLFIRNNRDKSKIFKALYRKYANKLHINDEDNGNKWTQQAYEPGSDSTLTNSKATLLCPQTDAYSGGPSTWIVRWAVKFTNDFLGNGTIFITTTDRADNSSGIRRKAGIRIRLSQSSPPENASVGPSSGTFYTNTPEPIIFTTTYRDDDTKDDIRFAEFLVRDATDIESFIRLAYISATGKLRLSGDDGKWIKKVADDGSLTVEEYTPGSDHTLENSFTILDCSQTEVNNTNPNELIINWAIRFKHTFLGAKELLLAVTEHPVPGREEKAFIGWDVKGNINIKRPTPFTIDIEDKARFYEGDTVEIIAESTETHFGRPEFRFLVDGNVKQEFSIQGIFNWQTTSTDVGRHTIKIEAKDTNGITSSELDIFIFRRPLNPR